MSFTLNVEDIQVPALSGTEQDTLTSLLVQWDSKKLANYERSSRYDGKNATQQLGGQLTPPALRNLGLVLGWPAIAVDTLNRRCTLEGFTDQLDLGVDDVFRENWLPTESGQADVSSLIHGTAFLVNTLGDTTAGEPEALITSRDALTGTGLWSGRSRRLESFLSLNEFNQDGSPIDMVMYLPNLIITMHKMTGGWSVDKRPHPYGVPAEPLTYRARLGRPFGYSRISRAVASIHNQALRTMLRSEVTAELYQLPQRVLLGGDESSFMDAKGNITPQWQAVMGAIWVAPSDEDGNRPDIKQLPGAPTTPYLEQLRMQAQLFAGETLVPVGTLGLIGDANPTSADAYMASYGDLIAEAEATTDGWSPAWQRSMIRALAMREGLSEVPEEWWAAVTPQWRNPAFLSRAAVADAGTKQLASVPWLADTEVGLELLGLTPDQIKRALNERRRAEGRQSRQRLLMSQTPTAGQLAQGQEVTSDINNNTGTGGPPGPATAG